MLSYPCITIIYLQCTSLGYSRGCNWFYRISCAGVITRGCCLLLQEENTVSNWDSLRYDKFDSHRRIRIVKFRKLTPTNDIDNHNNINKTFLHGGHLTTVHTQSEKIK